MNFPILIRKYECKLNGVGMACKYSKKDPFKLFACDGDGLFYQFSHYKLDLLSHDNLPLTQSIIPNIKTRISDWMLNDFSLNSENTHAFIGSADTKCYLLDLETNKKIRENAFSGHSNSVKCVDFSEVNSSLAISGAKDGRVFLWDLRVNSNVKSNLTLIYKAVNERITGATFLQDEKLVGCSKTNSQEITILDARMSYKIDNRTKKFSYVKCSTILCGLNKQIFLENQLRIIETQLKRLGDLENKLIAKDNLKGEFTRLKNECLDQFYSLGKKDEGIQGVTFLKSFYHQRKLLTNSARNELHCYDLDLFEIIAPKIFVGHQTFGTNSQ